jgi:hypothetical protein
MNKVKIRHLIFINDAGAFDMNDNEYTNFLVNVEPFLRLNLANWYICWYKQYLQS